MLLVNWEGSAVNNYEQLTTFSLEDLASWLDKNGQFDGSPWITWFDEKYCKNCPPIELNYEDSVRILNIKPFYRGTSTCAYCEQEKKCKFFPDMVETPDNRDIIELWLKEQVKNDKKK